MGVTSERSDDGVLTVTISAPGKKNALSTQMLGELKQSGEDAATDHDVRVVVLTGAGDDFCSGADLSERKGDRGHWLPYVRWFGTVIKSIHDLPKPTIAKVRGDAVGAGANLALGCDLIVASTEARFSEIFVKRGLSLDAGGSYVLPRLVGLHKAKELAFFGKTISAEEAERLGVVNSVIPDDEIDQLVDDWARELASLPPLALSLTKRLLHASLGSSLDQTLEAEAMAQALNFSTDDTREAIRAYREHRPAQYHMR